MNPFSLQENCSKSFSAQTSPLPRDGDDQAWFAPTLRTPRFPEAPQPRGHFSLAGSAGNNSTRGHHHPESDLFDASMRALNHRPPPDNSTPTLRMVEFSVELPGAEIVQLAADFTDWAEFPLDMVRFDGGIWSLTVPLPPGIYAYRFIVDGEWYDDPRTARHNSTSVEPTKAYVKVR